MKTRKRPVARPPEWLAGLSGEGAIYLAIVDRMDEAIRAGALKPGDLLPTHRHLAQALSVNVGTITRAYAEAKQRGLIGAGRRRGSFVLARATAAAIPMRGALIDLPSTSDLIDLTTSRPIGDLYGKELSRSLIELAQDAEAQKLFQEYYPSAGLPAHRAAAAAWIKGSGMDADPGQMLVCNGAQHGLVAALLAVARPGDLVLTEGLTYAGVKVLASLIGVRLHGLPMDEAGLLPGALAAICAAERPRALICVPNLHNPTNAILSAERRLEIAEIARRHDLIVIEDDVYGAFLENRLPPIATAAPDHTFMVASLSKAISPGMRVGFLLAPQRLVARATAGIRGTTWMASPLMAEIAARWIMDGTADRIVAAQREELKRRQALAAIKLSAYEFRGHPCSPQVWLRLPSPWRSEEFHLQARDRGVAVMPAEAFAVGHVALPHAVRLNIGAAQSEEQLGRALDVILALLQSRPEPAYLIA